MAGPRGPGHRGQGRNAYESPVGSVGPYHPPDPSDFLHPLPPHDRKGAMVGWVGDWGLPQKIRDSITGMEKKDKRRKIK